MTTLIRELGAQTGRTVRVPVRAGRWAGRRAGRWAGRLTRTLVAVVVMAAVLAGVSATPAPAASSGAGTFTLAIVAPDRSVNYSTGIVAPDLTASAKTASGQSEFTATGIVAPDFTVHVGIVAPDQTTYKATGVVITKLTATWGTATALGGAFKGYYAFTELSLTTVPLYGLDPSLIPVLGCNSNAFSGTTYGGVVVHAVSGIVHLFVSLHAGSVNANATYLVYGAEGCLNPPPAGQNANAEVDPSPASFITDGAGNGYLATSVPELSGGYTLVQLDLCATAPSGGVCGGNLQFVTNAVPMS